MSRRNVDTSTRYSTSNYKSLPESCEIEYLEVDTVTENKLQKKLIYKEPYLPTDEKLVEAVNLAIALGRPLLLQGEPGCGKTRIAYAVAYALGLPLEVSYIKSTSRAQDLLYTYDAVNRLYDAQLGTDGPRTEDGTPRSQKIQNYIRIGPLGRAISRAQYGRRSVVLIDEIDKADLDFPNDLLWELERLEFRVTEASEMPYAVGDKPELRPIVFVTHNEEKALPTAFLRRCIFHYVKFPRDKGLLQQVLETHEIADQKLSKKAIEVLLKLRELDLNKPPGLSELLDWVGYLEAVKTPIEELDKLPYMGALLKQESDRKRAQEIQRTPIPDKVEEIASSNEQKEDYTRLQDLLADEQWREADEETWRLMLRTSGREQEGNLREEDLKKISCEVLCHIDNLWVKFSEGHFGFRVQKEIWQSPEVNYHLAKFIACVGWGETKIDEAGTFWFIFKHIDNLSFNLAAPKGQLPVILGYNSQLRSESISRFIRCGLGNV